MATSDYYIYFNSEHVSVTKCFSLMKYIRVFLKSHLWLKPEFQKQLILQEVVNVFLVS